MLARLQMTLDRTDLTERLILSEPRTPSFQSTTLQIPTLQSTGLSIEVGYALVVGYSGSLRSQAALDLTLCLAHQTRLATGKPVTVQVFTWSKRKQKLRSMLRRPQTLLSPNPLDAAIVPGCRFSQCQRLERQ